MRGWRDVAEPRPTSLLIYESGADGNQDVIIRVGLEPRPSREILVEIPYITSRGMARLSPFEARQLAQRLGRLADVQGGTP